MLREVDLRGLDLGALQAGASVKGEFEKRLKGVINEIKSSPKQIVLFIDEAHTLIGAGGGPGQDAANLLKPALARGELRTIAATTWSEYKKYFEKDAALERRFQPVKVDEPSEHNAVVMLRGIRKIYEAAHKVTIRDEAVVAAVSLSHRYIAGRQLPDKAIDLLDTASATVKIEQKTRPSELVALDQELAALERAREAQTRDITDGAPVDLEKHSELLARIDVVRDEQAALDARWQAEKVAVEALTAARIAVRAAPEGSDTAALQEALAAADRAHQDLLAGASPLIHTEVDSDAVAAVVERWTGVPAGKMRASTIGAVLRLEDELSARVRGQDEAMQVVISRSPACRAPARPARWPSPSWSARPATSRLALSTACCSSAGWSEDDATVTAYLDEIRALPVVRDRWSALLRRGVRWQERYVKHARIELPAATPGAASAGLPGQAGGAPGLDLQADMPAGALRAGDTLRVRLLRNGQPLPGLPLALRNDLNPLTLWHRSDADGWVTAVLPLAARWLLSGVDLQPSATDPDGWDSGFVSLHIETLPRR